MVSGTQPTEKVQSQSEIFTTLSSFLFHSKSDKAVVFLNACGALVRNQRGVPPHLSECLVLQLSLYWREAWTLLAGRQGSSRDGTQSDCTFFPWSYDKSWSWAAKSTYADHHCPLVSQRMNARSLDFLWECWNISATLNKDEHRFIHFILRA